MELGGSSLARRAVDMLRSGGCDPVIVVLPPDFGGPDDVVQDDCISFVEGGATRQESVANALRMVRSDRVVVHDAARPLATVPLLQSVLAALEGVDGVIPAIPMDETIKKVAEGRSVETVDRTSLWRAQTPSVFRTEVLRSAHERAAGEGFVGTDEGQLVERYGGSVAIVQGSRVNIKVTYPEDLHLVEALMAAQR
jgi:2-C-methyl-D-erythritol 4-phosphate cytidylyltransferase